MALIKKRTAKKSDRGLYLQDKELNQTSFTPGTNYKYIVDVKNRKIVILTSADTNDNKVSRRKLKNEMMKPVLDIRDKNALSAFEGCEYLQVSIFEDKVVVEGFVEEKQSVVSSIGRAVKNVFSSKKQRKVVDIRDVLKVKQVASVVLSRAGLSKAAGQAFEQLSLDLFESIPTVSMGQLVNIQSALKNIHIPLQISSLFSASGILDSAFEEEGFEIAFTLEKDRNASMTYEHNFNTKVTCVDIRDFDLNNVTESPVMLAGSPCQGFSNSNRYTHFLDNPNNLLIRKFIEAVKGNENCQVFCLENVPQVLSAGNGQFKNEIYEALSDFEIESGVLNAADFGSAQLRERAVFIGSKIGRIELPKPTVSPEQRKTVRQAFEGLHDGIPNQDDVSDPEEVTMQRIKSVPPGGNVFSIPEEIRPKGKHSNMYRRLKWDEPSMTIVNPRKAMLLHPEEDRILSVRECARLFDVPDTFKFLGTLNAKQQMIANAVPRQLGRAIAQVIKNAIIKWNLTQRFERAPV
ncbi:DNA cytosine methyltransferase [Brevibacillus centrosporus]|uniref:DNA cytosine methyltransferase n=1 Tax=Brevibacillus centrosporus TaxID=54910 RepID=UPI00114350D1|nr:DNA cytosine methyltransferase [Brevibacillus centrosporus]MEC2133388.1 DNA cytosine methyltransferase [Brevibacillus centrosporus]GED34870.1 hypothetical protein BCE02nite_60110 [Brevibacillus centrosporus]